jgi:hypothetical protein
MVGASLCIRSSPLIFPADAVRVFGWRIAKSIARLGVLWLMKVSCDGGGWVSPILGRRTGASDIVSPKDQALRCGGGGGGGGGSPTYRLALRESKDPIASYHSSLRAEVVEFSCFTQLFCSIAS